jgi:two-component system response regulator PilR (NtrC family)
VRELENMLERAVTLCTTGAISASDLHMRTADDAAEPPPPAGAAFSQVGAASSHVGAASSHVGAASSRDSIDSQVEDVQRQAIIEALEKTRYNKTAAAKLLGLSFRQLRYRIKKLGIE